MASHMLRLAAGLGFALTASTAQAQIVTFDFDVADGGWTVQTLSGTQSWGWSAGDAGWRVANSNSAGQTRLLSPLLRATGGSVAVTMLHRYNFELRPSGGCFDGGNTKVSFGGPLSVGFWTTGGYTGALSGAFGNPMGGESAWCGQSTGWASGDFVTAQESGSIAAGTLFQLAFDAAWDASVLPPPRTGRSTASSSAASSSPPPCRNRPASRCSAPVSWALASSRVGVARKRTLATRTRPVDHALIGGAFRVSPSRPCHTPAPPRTLSPTMRPSRTPDDPALAPWVPPRPATRSAARGPLRLGRRRGGRCAAGQLREGAGRPCRVRRALELSLMALRRDSLRVAVSYADSARTSTTSANPRCSGSRRIRGHATSTSSSTGSHGSAKSIIGSGALISACVPTAMYRLRVRR
jgi:hypothetical protein